MKRRDLLKLAGAGATLEESFKMVGIGVMVDAELCAAESASIQEAGMAQPIGQDEALSSNHGRNHSKVRHIAGSKHQSGLRPFEGGKGCLQFFMGGQCAANQTRGSSPRAVLLRCADRGLDDVRVGCQSQIVVGAQENHALPGPLHDRSR